MPTNPGGLVYGTILVAALLSAESAKSETYLKTVLSVVIVLIIYWLALAYSDFTGERVEHGEKFHYADFAAQATRQLSVLYGASVPLLAIVVCWVAGATLYTAVNVAIWTSVGIIILIEVILGIRTDLKGFDLARQISVGVILGLGVTALRVLLH